MTAVSDGPYGAANGQHSATEYGTAEASDDPVSRWTAAHSSALPDQKGMAHRNHLVSLVLALAAAALLWYSQRGRGAKGSDR